MFLVRLMWSLTLWQSGRALPAHRPDTISRSTDDAATALDDGLKRDEVARLFSDALRIR